MSPCYEPPRPDVHDNNELRRQIDKYVLTLKDIEEQCQHVLNTVAKPSEGRAACQMILDIIGAHWENA